VIIDNVIKIAKFGTDTCRSIGSKLGLSKSSVNRSQQKINNRSDVDGAAFFETKDGQQWLIKMVVATIFVFGIIAGVGAERIAVFFSLLSINAFVGLSASSVKSIENQIDVLILKYKNIWDNKIKDKASELTITPGGDETFFESLMIIVLMDLQSGFIFTENIEEKRDHETWEKVSEPWLPKFKILRCFVSDKAKAILKLATKTLNITRIPDLFHIMNDISSTMKYSFSRLVKTKYKLIETLKKESANGLDTVKSKAKLAALLLSINNINHKQKQYQKNLRKLSLLLHPFSVLSNKEQTTEYIEKEMMKSISVIKSIKEEFSISDKQKKLNRAEKQIPDAAKQIDMWWQWIHTSLDNIDLSPQEKEWLLYYLMPSIYWKNQINKTRSKIIKRFYRLSLNSAKTKLDSHHLSQNLLNNKQFILKWECWAEEMSAIFLRTSSAIEGRNGWLSQIHFNGRGLSSDRIHSQTTIHNYFLKRSNGSTACERLSGIKPANLFEYIIENIGALPEPRKGKAKKCLNPLVLKAVPH
jgi:hypothetical protein